MNRSKKRQCIGIILDGNRRWAKERGLTSFEGHKRGFENVEPILFAAKSRGVKHLIVYAFSTENWKRSKKEVAYLMELFESLARDRMPLLAKRGVAVRFIGQRERWPKSLRVAVENSEKNNPKKPSVTLWWCVSYGGRADIVQAAEKAKSISEVSIAKHLWTAGMPGPDLIIRPGGEMRLSNFLLWQASYSELFFTKTLWPAFTAAALNRILKEYAKRERRMGT
jgi:undecaprenyl diphosphate synthase